MFVPNTKGGIRFKKMKENEDKLATMTGFKISYIESAGTKLGSIFSLDLSKDQPRGRNPEKCSQCSSRVENKLNCKAMCKPYESKCTICNPEIIKPKPTDSRLSLPFQCK